MCAFVWFYFFSYYLQRPTAPTQHFFRTGSPLVRKLLLMVQILVNGVKCKWNSCADRESGPGPNNKADHHRLASEGDLLASYDSLALHEGWVAL